MKRYTVEYQTGDVQMVRSNILLNDVTDMVMVEFWEDRLRSLDQPFVVAYRKVARKVLYSIFTDLRKKDSVFK